MRNLNHFEKQLKNKDLVIQHDEVRKIMDENVFKGCDAIVMPEVRIKMLNEAFDEQAQP